MCSQLSVVVILLLFFIKKAFQSTNPNIIFILADDLGWNDVGFHGSNQIPTPNIDALAYTGIILQNYYVTPICTPSRSALLTGKYPIHTGLQHGVIHGSSPYGLSLSEKIFPEFLKMSSYMTRAIGKWHLGMQHRVIYGGEPWGLGLDEKILPQYLKKAGYVTAAFGKWHLGHFKKEYLPEARGWVLFSIAVGSAVEDNFFSDWYCNCLPLIRFDSHYGCWTGHHDYYDHTAEEKFYFRGYDMRRGMNITWSDYGKYTTDLLTEEAVQVIKNHDSTKPLFLYLAHLATHSANGYVPLQAPSETVAKFEYIKNKNRRLFAGMLSKLDDSIGNVVSALAEAKLLKNSIIIFSTDNGGPAAGFNLNAASNWPLRGVKDTLWEGGVRGAGFIWSPLLPSTKISKAMIHITDWLPTLLHLTDSIAPDNVDGVNVWKALSEGTPSPREEILLNIDTERNLAGLIHKNWKYIRGSLDAWNGWYGPPGRNFSYKWNELYNSAAARAIENIKHLPKKSTISKLRKSAEIICAKKKSTMTQSEVYLFDLEKDPCEQINIAFEYPDKIKLMEKILKEYFKTAVPPRNKPTDIRSDPKYWGYAWTNWMDFL